MPQPTVEKWCLRDCNLSVWTLLVSGWEVGKRLSHSESLANALWCCQLGQTGSTTLQSICTHSIHTCPGLHQKAGFQCLLDRSVRKRLGRAQPTRDHRGSSGHWVRVGKWRQNGEWGTKNFRGGGWEPTPGCGRGWDPTRAETQLRLPTSLRRVPHGLKTLLPDNISGKRKAFIFQNSNSRALSLRTSPSALGPVWLASSQKVSPDPNMSMKESQHRGRWDRGD